LIQLVVWGEWRTLTMRGSLRGLCVLFSKKKIINS
jgi:hypothetical protein